MYFKKLVSKCILSKKKALLVLPSRTTLSWSPNAKLNKGVLDKYMCLPIPECACQVEYVWIDGTGTSLRSRTRNFNFPIACHKEAPTWTIDGTESYFEACGDETETFLCPVAIYNDPARRGKARIVLCDTYQHDHKPTKTNFRSNCLQVVNAACEHEPMTGFYQQYHFLDVDGRPYGWPKMGGFPAPRGPYYGGVGATRAYCRDIVEAHYRACLYAGINYGGTHAESNLSQWEFSIADTMGIKAADDLWMARYLLVRIAEEFGVTVCFRPKLFPQWKGSQCRTTFSSNKMRKDEGLKNVETAVEKLCKKQDEHLKIYYPPNCPIDSSECPTKPSFNVQIPKYVKEKKKGWFEDRRGRSNADPYRILETLVSTCLKD